MVKPYRRTVRRVEEMFVATSTRPARRAGRNRTDVLRAAGEVIAARGVEGTRFSDVSAASGVPVSTLQYYFGNREDMIAAALRHVGAEEIALLQRTLDETGHSSSWQQLVGLIRVGVAQESTSPVYTWRLWVELWRSAMRDDELRADALNVARRWRELLVTVIERGQRAGEFRGDVSAVTVAHQTMCLMDGVGIPAALADPTLTSPLRLVTEAVAALLGVESEPLAD
jgi:AcrR family transcriptional regulator